MAFIIIFSTVWRLYFQEWKGSSRPTRSLVTMGIAVVIASTLLVGYGNFLAGLGE
jgi:L-rhamnose-H+ transport protein